MFNRLLLRAGDSIGIISTARWLEPEQLHFADQLFKSWGLNPVYSKNLYAQYGQLAGDDEFRTVELQRFLDDPEIKCIICARGGYGTIRILNRIDFSAFMKNPKFVCGFSDVSVLLAHITDKLGIPAIHCAMPYTFPKNTEASLQSLQNVLFGNEIIYQNPKHDFNKHGNAEGVLIGGNLSILYSLLGTNYGFSTNGKILFLEDIDEYLYHVDRMMMSMKLAGKLISIKGIIIGAFTDMKDNLIPFGKTAESIILEHVSELGIPVSFGFPAGHIDNNSALYFGRKISLSVNTDGTTIKYL